MTLPEELVTAATQALQDADVTIDPIFGPPTRAARIAVAAVLRALPESQRVAHAVTGHLLDEAWAGRWRPLDETNLQPLAATAVNEVFAALARLAEQP